MRNPLNRQELWILSVGILLASSTSDAGEYRAIGRYERSSRAVPKDATALWNDYQAAVADASEAKASEIVRDLVALTPYDRSLHWREIEGASRVLVVTWTGWDGYVGQVGNDMELGVDVWVTPFPKLRDFAADSGLTGLSLEIRLKQRLGLPPDDAKTYVVEMWVDPSDLFRPAPDPEVTDRDAELDYPLSSRYVTISATHQNWIENLKGQSYSPDGYPWTRLGYTYDWGAATDTPVGFSEFVVRQGAEVRIESVSSTADYAELGNYNLRRVCRDFLEYADRARQDWLIPAMAVGVVYRDQVICASAFGSCDLDGTLPADVDTLFQIGSVSKSFTSLLTAILVDRGFLEWSDPITDLAPDFAFKDPNTTEAFLLGDAMAQHPGVPAQSVTALAFFGLPQEDMIAAYRYVEPVGLFRRDYAYQNGLFSLTGEICAQVLSKSYAQCIEDELFDPLGMTASRATVDEFLAVTDRARTHAYIGQEIDRGIREITSSGFVPYYMVDRMRPAGSLSSTLTDMLRYLRMQMGNGALEGNRLVSAENLGTIHSPQTSVVAPPQGRAAYYCMGWVLSDGDPAPHLWHNGDTTVSHSCIGFMPEEELGIVILSNVGGQNLPDVLMQQFFDMASNQPDRDQAAEALAAQRAWKPAPYEPPASPDPSGALEGYAGKYHNPGCGLATVAVNEGSLTLKLDGGELLLHLDHWSRDDFYIVDDLQVLVLDEDNGLVHFESGQKGDIEAMAIDLFEVDGLMRFTKTGASSDNTSLLKAY